VAAWEASSHTPFDLVNGQFEHATWPPGLAVPKREEMRTLVHRGLLERDDSVAPVWRVFPSAAARELVGVAEEEALGDPDRRLGLILEATVTAFEADPREPLHQLEDLGLIATAPAGRRSMTFWPTLHGRAAVKDAPSYLERLARETDDERENSRLQQWAKRLRAGDIAVGTIAGSTSGMLIRALMGL